MKKRITISLTSQIIEDLEKIAKARNITKSDIIVLAIEKYKNKKVKR